MERQYDMGVVKKVSDEEIIVGLSFRAENDGTELRVERDTGRRCAEAWAVDTRRTRPQALVPTYIYILNTRPQPGGHAVRVRLRATRKLSCCGPLSIDVI